MSQPAHHQAADSLEVEASHSHSNLNHPPNSNPDSLSKSDQIHQNGQSRGINPSSIQEWDGGELDQQSSNPNHLHLHAPQMTESKSNSTISPTSYQKLRNKPSISDTQSHDSFASPTSSPSSADSLDLAREVKVSIPDPVLNSNAKPRSSISSHTSPRRTSLLSLPPTTFHESSPSNLHSEDHRRGSIASASVFGSNSASSTYDSDAFIISPTPNQNGFSNDTTSSIIEKYEGKSNNNTSSGDEEKSKASLFNKLWPPSSKEESNPTTSGPRFRHNRGSSQFENIADKDGSSSHAFSIDVHGLSSSHEGWSGDQGPSSPIATGNSSGTNFGNSFSVSHRPGKNSVSGGSGHPHADRTNHPKWMNGPYPEKSKNSDPGSAVQTNVQNKGMQERSNGPPPSSVHGYGPSYGYSPYGSSTTFSNPLRNPTLNGSSSNQHGYPNHSNFSSPYGSKYGITLSNSPSSSKVLNQKDREGFEALLKATESPFSWDTKDGQEEFDDFLHQESDDENPNGSSRNHAAGGDGGYSSNYHSKVSLNSIKSKKNGKKSLLPGTRAVLNVGTLTILIVALLMLFAGYPIINGTKYLHSSANSAAATANSSFNSQPLHVGNINDYDGFPELIDPETPKDLYEKLSVDGKTKMKLVFSDEFNTDGRSFYPGDDPYWEAVDLWYWGTNNYEWYDPAAVTTKDGALQITLSEQPIHDLNFRGGMIQSWNKFCFTGGLLEASVRLPGYSDVSGLWPAFWMMGNLGRAGYGASLEGLWPYSYEECDVGTIFNQTTPEGIPAANARGGRTAFNGKYNTQAVSWLPGQRLSACTCPNEDHPGPKDGSGNFKGRGAVEIDIFEAQVGRGKADPSTRVMQLSQSAQFAPMNNEYIFTNTTGPAFDLFTPLQSEVNSYKGAAYQQSGSIVSDAPVGVTEKGVYGAGDPPGGFATYGAEYTPGKTGQVTWVTNDTPTVRINPSALEPDPVTQISNRVMATEPMYIILNLGISQNFGTPDWRRLEFPNTMSVDWVRVYQPEGSTNVGCDPDDYPTADYISRHSEAYNNPLLQFWGEGGYGQDWPLNSVIGCSAQRSKGGIEDPLNPHKLAPYISQAELPPYE